MTLVTGNKAFTLIEVLLAIAILSIGMVWIIEGYQSILNGIKMTQGLTDASLILHEKMAETELEVKLGEEAGKDGGSEGPWEWSTEVVETETEGLYKIQGYVTRKGGKRSVSLETYVQQQ